MLFHSENQIRNLETRVYLLVGADLMGEYPNGELGDNPLLLWAKNVRGTATAGLEIQSVFEVTRRTQAGIYGGATIQAPTRLPIEITRARGYVGGFAETRLFRFEKEIGVEFEFGEEGQAVRLMNWTDLNGEGAWEPIGGHYTRWGPANRSARRPPALQAVIPEPMAGQVAEERLIENVTRVSAPSAVLDNQSQVTVLFALHDPAKPWHAATDIAVADAASGSPAVLNRIADDQQAEFSPRIAVVSPERSLAAWTRVSGDISQITEPGEIEPHLEIVASWLDRATGTWSPAAQLTANAIVDRDPLPVMFGDLAGIVWIQNEGGAEIGNAVEGDHLLFSAWDGSGWTEAQMLWSGPNGIIETAFTADGSGEGHLVFAVDTDGDPETSEDRELYAVGTRDHAWEGARRITSDSVEDSLPVLVAPGGVPLCIWKRGRELLYTPLLDWNPRAVFTDAELPAEAPTLSGVTMPGGAAVVYTVQDEQGVDIVGSF